MLPEINPQPLQEHLIYSIKQLRASRSYLLRQALLTTPVTRLFFKSVRLIPLESLRFATQERAHLVTAALKTSQALPVHKAQHLILLFRSEWLTQNLLSRALQKMLKVTNLRQRH